MAAKAQTLDQHTVAVAAVDLTDPAAAAAVAHRKDLDSRMAAAETVAQAQRAHQAHQWMLHST
jgi:hypothetical protein